MESFPPTIKALSVPYLEGKRHFLTVAVQGRARTGEREGGVREGAGSWEAGPTRRYATLLTGCESDQSYGIPVFKNHFKMTSRYLVKKPLERQMHIFINIAFY